MRRADTFGLSSLLFLCASVHGWTTISQTAGGVLLANIQHGQRPNSSYPEYSQRLGYLWSLPDEPSSTRGLGGGISWGWDPSLCSALLPGFGEDLGFYPYVGCHELVAAMHRAFASWADNHAQINFIDVTSECVRIGYSNASCPLAELWIDSMHGVATDTNSGVAEEGLHLTELSNEESSGGSSVAVAQPRTEPSQTFRYTNGRRAAVPFTPETSVARIRFNPVRCVSHYSHHVRVPVPVPARVPLSMASPVRAIMPRFHRTSAGPSTPPSASTSTTSRPSRGRSRQRRC